MELAYEQKEINIAEITKIIIKGRKAICIAFEEGSENAGDCLNLAILFHPDICEIEENLYEALKFFKDDNDVLMRIHSECLLGDALHSSICDCRDQLNQSISRICEINKGILIYLRQEGRGIGLRAKLACLSLQEGYLDGQKTREKCTPDQANIAMGHPVDARNYDLAVKFIESLGVKSIRLITGNPEKVSAFKQKGIKVRTEDIQRTELTQKAKIELREKIERDYFYDGFKRKTRTGSPNARVQS